MMRTLLKIIKDIKKSLKNSKLTNILFVKLIQCWGKIKAGILKGKIIVYFYLHIVSARVCIKYANTGGHCHFRYEWFISFWLRPLATWGERHNAYYADHTVWPHQHAAYLKMFKISVGRDPKNSILQLNGWIPNCIFDSPNPTLNSEYPTLLNGRNSTVWFHDPISTLNWLFFKIIKFSGPSLLGMTSSTLQPHFLSGRFIMTNGDCYIICVWA